MWDKLTHKSVSLGKLSSSNVTLPDWLVSGTQERAARERRWLRGEDEEPNSDPNRQSDGSAPHVPMCTTITDKPLTADMQPDTAFKSLHTCLTIE